jgi:eukaryotic-like serine/threonine-protein kinase
MTLTSGTRLGPYEIVAPLGAGGMGEVYRACDTRLGRDVAVKVLPLHLSSNPDLKARFEREAKAISSLNHPHICTLHDVGHQDGIDFLVMELLEGETLADRLQKGTMPLKQALEVGVQIAEALEKAHLQGIIHRDLKPGNIMLTKTGAKLLDFGLAKPNIAAIGAVAASSSGKLTPSTPTMSVAALASPAGGLTQQGTIVGTFQYMAPECLQGQEADARSDLFSFGCVLYEMVTGRRAFDGKSQLSVLTAILEKDPEPISTLDSRIPASVEQLIFACLAKDSGERLQTAHDAKLQLRWIQSAAQELPSGERRASKEKILAIAACLFAAMAMAVGLGWWESAPPRPVTRLSVLPPEGTRFAPLYRNGSPALSPDGTRLIFVASREGKTSLWIRDLNKLEPRELPGTAGAYFPFWSPDGKSIGFFANGKLWRMDSGGGPAVAICDAREARGGSWAPGNVILFTPVPTSPVVKVSAEGGILTTITPTAQSHGASRSDRWPFALPDGKHFLYLYAPNGNESVLNEIRFASMDGKLNKSLLTGDYTNPEYSSGWLLVGRGGTLIAQRFDAERGTLSGEQVQITGGLQTDSVVGSSIFSVSQGGMLAYLRGPIHGGEQHVWMDAKGRQTGQASDPGTYGATRLSPDDTEIATVNQQSAGEFNIWIWDPAHGRRTRLSADGFNVDTPVWSADGRAVYFAYAAKSDEVLQIYSRPIDGSQPMRLAVSSTDAVADDVTEDNKLLLYEESTAEAGTGQSMAGASVLKALPLAGGAKPITLLERVDFGSNATVRPLTDDWLAYQSSESGGPEIYLTRFPNAGARYQVSLAGGTQAVWSKDGKRLYYLDPGQTLMAVDVKTEKNSVQIGAPVALFQTAIRSSVFDAGYAVTRDGRFLVLNATIESPSPITLVTNWTAELKK